MLNEMSCSQRLRDVAPASKDCTGKAVDPDLVPARCCQSFRARTVYSVLTAESGHRSKCARHFFAASAGERYCRPRSSIRSRIAVQRLSNIDQRRDGATKPRPELVEAAIEAHQPRARFARVCRDTFRGERRGCRSR